MLPDGSCSSITLRPGASIREVLHVLCHSISVNIAAVDLFLVGGEKVRAAHAANKLLTNANNICCEYTRTQTRAANISWMNWISLLFIIKQTLVNPVHCQFEQALFCEEPLLKLNWKHLNLNQVNWKDHRRLKSFSSCIKMLEYIWLYMLLICSTMLFV